MAKQIICDIENHRYGNKTLELIDIDHDAGEYVRFGGDYIKLLDWLEATGRNYPIRIHSQNPRWSRKYETNYREKWLEGD